MLGLSELGQLVSHFCIICEASDQVNQEFSLIHNRCTACLPDELAKRLTWHKREEKEGLGNGTCPCCYTTRVPHHRIILYHMGV